VIVKKKTPTDIIIRTEHWKETTAEKYKRGNCFGFFWGNVGRARERGELGKPLMSLSLAS
jgi:hypothetical protein